MELKKILNDVSNNINKEVRLLTSNYPLGYVYIGYLVSKGMSMENTNDNGNITRDLYLYTYLTEEPSIFALMEDGTYKEIETGIKYKKLDYYTLVSKHLDRGLDIDMTKYPMYNKREYLGVFNLTKFEEIVDTVIDREQNSKDVSLKMNTIKKKSYTSMELKGILKRYYGKKNESKTLTKTFVVPPVLKDELDPIKTVYTLESKFVMEYYGKPEKEIYEDIKQKSDDYFTIKNQ